MARYKAEKPLFVGIRYVYAGEEFESDDTPGKFWIPLDSEGEAAIEARPPAARDARSASLAKAREAAKRNREARAAAAKKPQPTGLKGRDKDGQRTPTASSAKDRPPTPGKPVAEQQTDGEEPTRP